MESDWGKRSSSRLLNIGGSLSSSDEESNYLINVLSVLTILLNLLLLPSVPPSLHKKFNE